VKEVILTETSRFVLFSRNFRRLKLTKTKIIINFYSSGDFVPNRVSQQNITIRLTVDRPRQ